MRLIELHNLLRAAVPSVTGVARPRDFPASPIVVSYESPPSVQDEATVQQIVDSFDWAEPVPPTREQVLDRLSRLTTEQKQRVLDIILENLVLSDPKLLDRAEASIRTR